MHPHQVDAASGASLVGGELQDWSDAEALRPSPAIARLVAAALPASASRVLLAGPAAESLLPQVPDDVPVDLLVRGLDDARALAARVAGRPRTTVLCGALDRLPADVTYSAVVAIGGPGLLLAPDSHPMDVPAVLTKLASLVADDGVLVADIANSAGLHTLIGAAADERGDDQWFHGSRDFGSALTLPDLEAALDTIGLTTTGVYAGWPSPTELALLAERAALGSGAPPGRSGTSGTVGALAVRAESEHFSERPALRDPWDATERLLEAGLGLATAPAWVVAARRGTHSPDLPQVIAAEPRLAHPFARVATLPADPSAPQPVAEGLLRRDLATPLPEAAGPLLESLLRRACAQGSRDAVRELLRRYAGWLRDPAAWPEAQRASRVFATPANVVVDGAGGLTLLDRSWSWAEDLDAETAVAFGLRDLAQRLVASGARHPWAPNTTAAALTEELAVMTEAQWPPEDERLTALESAYAAAGPGRVAPGRSVELDQARAEALRRTLDERDRQVTWLEGTLSARDRQVRTLQRAISVENSAAYKAVHGLSRPVPALRRRVRAALDRTRKTT